MLGTRPETSVERKRKVAHMARNGRRTPATRRFMAWLLRSPFAGLVDGSVMLITVQGQRTGSAYPFPVQYARDGEEIWVFAGHSERRRLMWPFRGQSR